MSGDLDDLARTAADALVSAMLTDSWELVKRRFVALVGHERRMDVARATVAATSGLDRERARLVQGRVWSTRVRDVLDDDPAVADRLRALLADLASAQPSVVPTPQHAQAHHASQAVNVGGNITGGAGELHVGVSKVDKRKYNIALAPFIFLLHTGKKIVTAHPLATTTGATLVIATAAAAGWHSHWPPAVFGAPVTQSSTASSPGQPVSTPVKRQIVTISPLGTVHIGTIRRACAMVSSGSLCPRNRFSYATRVLSDGKIEHNTSYVIMQYISSQPANIQMNIGWPYYFCGFTKSRDGTQDLLTQIPPSAAPFTIPEVTYGIYSLQFYNCSVTPTNYPDG